MNAFDPRQETLSNNAGFSLFADCPLFPPLFLLLRMYLYVCVTLC